MSYVCLTNVNVEMVQTITAQTRIDWTGEIVNNLNC